MRCHIPRGAEEDRETCVCGDMDLLGSESELTFKCKAYEPADNQQVNGSGEYIRRIFYR